MRLWMGVAVVVVAYALLFPFLGEGKGPQVGLQQPVYLFSQYVGIGPAVVSAMFLFLLRLKSPLCWLAGAVCLAELAVLQMKGLYIAVPMVVILLGFAAGKMQTHLPRKLGASMLLGGVLLAVALPFIPTGRVANVSFSTFIEQFTALDGDKDKAGGEAVSDRIKWQTRTWEEQKKSVGDMVWGMGLGRDLTAGFNAGGDANVRKPHNDYIEIQARYGFIGLGLWLAFIGSLLIPVWRGARSSHLTKDERQFLLWVLATAITALIIAGTQPLLAYPYGTAAIFCTLGMGLALVRGAEGRYKAELESAQWSMALADGRKAS
jgi:O-antigen ligase